MNRTVVAMSGGVDSTVAAALLVEQGHEVVGLSMQLYDQREGGPSFGSCCTLDDLHDARRAARHLGIPHYIVNFERPFEERVVRNFVSEYLAGRTPIPCAHCNSDVKFATLVDRAAGLGADRLATGHYVRVDHDGRTGPFVLRRGADARKDQAYFLFALTQEQLSRAVFPVGAMTKPEVREYARRRGLPVADKPDSHEICFVPDGDYAAFVERATSGAARKPGVVTDAAGRVLGTHEGVHHFTIGQRKGLRLSTGTPLYVTEIRADTRTVVVGRREALDRGSFEVDEVNWVSGETPGEAVVANVQIRHRHPAATARVEPLDGRRARVTFDVPQPAVTPGQAAVFFDGEIVLGGGWIAGAAGS